MTTLFPENNTVLVIGDAILDIYHFGRVDRISPEAPVPIVQVVKTERKLGGAANVANNISKLRNDTILLGYSGQDHNAASMKELLELYGIKYNLVVTEQPTITKVRVISGVQQIVRVDFEEIYKISDETEKIQRAYIDKNIDACGTIILSDYGKGSVTSELSKYVIETANKSGKIIIVDPKGSDWEKYRKATIITPNVKELGDVVGHRIENEDDEIVEAGRVIQRKYEIKYLLVTRSEKGMTFFDTDSVHHVRITATEVFDVSGAGDTVVATLATGLSSGYCWIDAVKMANKAAGIVVSKIGTEPITYGELEKSIAGFQEENKIISQDKIEKLGTKLRDEGKKIVFTNGCFDIIHKGHIKYLQQAKKLGDVLIVGLNSDKSIKRLKGLERPIKKEDERSLILSALEFIDYVVIFDEDTPFNTIRSIQPDILAKGGDYKIEDVVGREFAKETVLISFVEGYSTTSTINKMKELD
jgi:D-beta-D-heptose 7-phosphate kinase / D-beta-D-heptose 1-phosphate adenosyltransferase